MTHAETAYWVACHRAAESERQDALFRDPFAEMLAGDRGPAILDRIGPAGQSWTFVVRTYLMDAAIGDLASRSEIDAVINLGAGLDTRPQRLALPPELLWVEVDLPEVIEYKEQRLAGTQSACRLVRRALDLGDLDSVRELSQELGGQARRTLIVTEGTLVYLAPDVVERLTRELRGMEAVRFWLTDLSPAGLARFVAPPSSDAEEGALARYRFVPAAGTRYFVERRWSVRSTWSLIDWAIRLRRAPEQIVSAGLSEQDRGVDIGGGVALMEPRPGA
jgi:methyltransferase (TIGR00027 family)